ncbi:MAG TPA: MFS transporter [Opitutaceae bacterium]|nr:MFS transporter [Opitutaceae bacterium]
MSRRAALFLLPLIYAGYISLGLPDGTLGVAWPKIHVDLAQPLKAAGWIMVVGTLLSAVASFSSGPILRRFTTGPVVLASCLLTGGAIVLMSQAPRFAWLVAAAIPLGLGAGAVDAALNGYVARHYTGRHMNWLHACWGIGATTGPLLITQFLATSHGWRGGYLLIGSLQLGLAAIFLFTLRLWTEGPAARPAPAADSAAPPAAPLHPAHSEAGWLSALLFMLYVAAEGSTGLWATSILVVGRGIPQAEAGVCAALFYAAITGGRIATGFVVDRWGNRRLVTGGALLALVGILLFSQAGSAPFAAAALILTGIGMAPIFPGLMHEVPRRFQPDAVFTIIGRQSGAACIGAALFPAAAGWLGDAVSLDAVVWAVALGVVLLVLGIRRLDRIS